MTDVPPDPLKTIAVHESIAKVNRERRAYLSANDQNMPLVAESDTFERVLLEFGFFIARGTTPDGTGG